MKSNRDLLKGLTILNTVLFFTFTEYSYSVLQSSPARTCTWGSRTPTPLHCQQCKVYSVRWIRCAPLQVSYILERSIHPFGSLESPLLDLSWSHGLLQNATFNPLTDNAEMDRRRRPKSGTYNTSSIRIDLMPKYKHVLYESARPSSRSFVTPRLLLIDIIVLYQPMNIVWLLHHNITC